MKCPHTLYEDTFQWPFITQILGAAQIYAIKCTQVQSNQVYLCLSIYSDIADILDM